MTVAQLIVFELGKDVGARQPVGLRGKGREGASGTVYELSFDNGKAIKIYHETERGKFEDKIRTMVKVKYHRPHADRFDLAWPEAIFIDASGGFQDASLWK
jgi:DNA-binding helix-hairpin-helix protein with protein kinase domain